MFVAVVQGRLFILKCVCSASEKSCIGFGIGLIGTVLRLSSWFICSGFGWVWVGLFCICRDYHR